MKQVIVLNGGSSSGKSTIARALQAILAEPWLHFGVDTLLETMPDGLITYHDDGGITLRPGFRELEAAWMQGVAAMARAGAHIILDEVFLSGAEAQARWQQALDGLPVLWVGVRCDAVVAAARETARGDRVPGMARLQAEAAHRGMRYDIEVDSAAADPTVCAQRIAACL